MNDEKSRLSRWCVNLVEIEHYYPFLAHCVFGINDTEFNEGVFLKILTNFSESYQKQHISTKALTGDDVAKQLFVALGDCNENVLISNESLSEIARKLNANECVSFCIPLFNMTWELKRFGGSLGIRVIDSQHNIHKAAVDVLREMSKSVASSAISTFKQAYSVSIIRVK